MKHLKMKLMASMLFVLGLVLIAADHIDAPSVQGTNADITDFYAFQGSDESNLVFVTNLQGLLSPMATETASFSENVLTEINIDTDADNVEDLVIQAIPRDGKMYIFGPVAPESTGKNSSVIRNQNEMEVEITNYGSQAIIAEQDGMKAFAGPRDDPFFMDFAQYGAIIGGTAPGFNDPGSDTFAGTNVMSLVIEVPKDMIGSTGTINTWVETKKK
jgi:hypothetical protein